MAYAGFAWEHLAFGHAGVYYRGEKVAHSSNPGGQARYGFPTGFEVCPDVPPQLAEATRGYIDSLEERRQAWLRAQREAQRVRQQQDARMSEAQTAKRASRLAALEKDFS